MTDNELFEFCGRCGKYLEAAESVVAYDEQGKAISVCRECKKGMYQERICDAMKKFFDKVGK